MNTIIENASTVNRQELEQKVKNMYREVALHPEVTYHFEMGRQLAERLGYPSGMLDKIPTSAIDSFAGVGYYFDLAQLKAGERVIDLGSGSGMDTFYASIQVGPTGMVTGVDMTDEQLGKAEHLRQKFGFNNVTFRKGYIEELPVESQSIDVAVSNGVINLCGDKIAVFREAARILKSGGRLVISDIVSSVRLPEKISCNATLWAACIGGAMQKEEYVGLIEEAGLKVTRWKSNPYQFLSKSARGATKDFGIESISLLAVKV